MHDLKHGFSPLPHFGLSTILHRFPFRLRLHRFFPATAAGPTSRPSPPARPNPASARLKRRRVRMVSERVKESNWLVSIENPPSCGPVDQPLHSGMGGPPFAVAQLFGVLLVTFAALSKVIVPAVVKSKKLWMPPAS